MSGRSDIEAGRAAVTLRLKDSQLIKGLRNIRGMMTDFGGQMMRVGGMLTGMGVAIGGVLLGAVKHFADAGSAINDLSARTGLAVGDIKELGYAAEMTGAGMEDVEKATKEMQKTIVDAAGGSKSAIETLAAAGVSLQDLAGMTTGEQIAHIGQTIADIQDPAKRTAAALDVFGKSGTKLLPMFKDLGALSKEARDLGLIPTEQAIKDADAMGDALDKVQKTATAVFFEIGAALAPALIPLAENVARIIGEITKWTRANAGIVQSIAAFAVGLTAAGAVVTTLGIGLLGIAALSTAAGVAFAAMTSPLVLLGGAAIAATAYFLKFTTAGKAMSANVTAGLLQLGQIGRDTFGGIIDALGSGDWQLAGEIAMKGVQLAFMQGAKWIQDALGGAFGSFFGTMGKQLIEGDFVGAWKTATLAIAKVWEDLVLRIVESFGGIGKALTDTWQGAVTGIANTMLEMSANGGATGKMMSKLLGVDLSEEEAKGLKQDRELAISQMKRAKASGDEKEFERLKRKVIYGEQPDMLRDAQNIATDDISKQADAIRGIFHDFDPNKAAGAVTDANKALATAIASGIDASTLKQLQDELAELNKKAAAERANRGKFAAGGAGAGGPIDSSAIKSSVFGTFSGQAAMLAGGYGNVQDKQVGLLDAVVGLAEKQLEALGLMDVNLLRIIDAVKKTVPEFK